jgi:hypothetical protein
MYSHYFCLGDSRTGTTSFHQFFINNHLPSLHHYEDLTGSKDVSEDDFNQVAENVVNFIKQNSYIAYSDYPTRLFYKILSENFPDAFFVLTLRDFSNWKKSMTNYFGVDYIKNSSKLDSAYQSLNADIKNFFNGKENFCILNIECKKSFNNFIQKSGLVCLSNLEIPHVNRYTDKYVPTQ